MQAILQVNASDKFSDFRQVHTQPSEVRSILQSDYFLTNFMGSGPRATVDFMGVTYHIASSCELLNNDNNSEKFIHNYL